MAQQCVDGSPIRSYFEWQGRQWKAYTNGKVYGDTRYVIATSDTGSQVKITYSLSKGISVGQGRSWEFGREAIRSLGFNE